MRKLFLENFATTCCSLLTAIALYSLQLLYSDTINLHSTLIAFSQCPPSSTKLHQRPFRAKHLGSLLRPKALLDERHLIDKNQGDQKRLASVEDESVKAIVKEQLDLGFHAVSDGKYRRHMFW